MKLLLEQWKRYLKEDDTDNTGHIFGYNIGENQKVFASNEPYTGLKPPNNPNPFKPSGLWYSCGPGWIEWVKSEMPEMFEGYNYLYEIKTSQKVFKIDNKKKLQQFKKKYSSKSMPASMGMIDWESTYNDMAGVEICPYPIAGAENRMSQGMWYYAWEVSSGVIWNKAGIQGEPTLLAEKTRK